MLKKLEPKHAALKEQFESIDARVNKLRQQLSALDQTFQLHEIQIDPAGLRPVVPHDHRRLVPHGQMSRQIRSILTKRHDWVSTAEIAQRIIRQLNAKLDDDAYAYVHIAMGSFFPTVTSEMNLSTSQWRISQWTRRQEFSRISKICLI